MFTRATSRQVVFKRPFMLNGFESAQAAGTYKVDSEEELIEELSFPAWKRTTTTIQLRNDGAIEHWTIDPDELHAALVHDSAQPDAIVQVIQKSRQRRARNFLNRLLPQSKTL